MKRGELAISTIVAAALALIILIILIFVFQSQISGFVKQLFNIGNATATTISGDTCNNFIEKRACYKQTCEALSTERGKTYVNAYPNGNSWKDCPTGEFCCRLAE